MTVQNSTAVRNAMLDAKATAIGPSPKLQLRTGAPPANCAAAATGALLAELPLPASWMTAAANGQKSFAAVTPVNAVASGTIGHYRILDSTGATCHEQGTVGLAGSNPDVAVDNPAVLAGQQVSVAGWTIIAPGA